MADDGTPLPPAFSLLALTASSVSDDILLELHQYFGGSDSSRSLQDGDGTDAEAWEGLARRGVPLASVVQGLSEAMEKGGKLGLIAADVYLGLLLTPGCPLYSLFSQVAFNSMLRCVRSAYKPPIAAANDETAGGTDEMQVRKGKGGKKRGKRTAGKNPALEDFGDGPCDFGADASYGDNQSLNEVSQDVILQLLTKLQAALCILHLKEHPESLRSLIELLVELPHLAREMQAEKHGGADCRSKRSTTHGSSSSVSISNLSFELMKMVLSPCHGDSMQIAVILMKLLTPTILLTRPEGNHHQKIQARDQALHFITVHLKRSSEQALKSAAVALPRYLAMKAPEKTELRALAVESVMVVVKNLSSQDQRKFGHFVAKMSRGKPRHRLFASDLVVALLGALPDPLGLNRDVDQEHVDQEHEQHGSEEREPMGEHFDKEICDTVLNDGEAQGKTGTNNVSPTTPRMKVWWGTACLEALLHRCSDKVPAIRARALSNLAQVLETLSSDIRNRVVLQSLLGFGTMACKETDFSIRKSALLSTWQTPGGFSPGLGGHTPSPEPSAVGPGASPLSPGAGHGDLGSLLRRRCLDEKVAVRKSTLLLMTKSASLLGRPPDETMLEAMGTACADPMVSIRKTALGALSEMMRKFPADAKVVTEWLQSALPLVMDNESSIQDECLSHFEELIVDRIACVATKRLPGCIPKSSLTSCTDGGLVKPNANQELERMLPPGILVMLKGMADDNAVTSCVKRVCLTLGKKKQLRAGIALALQNIITASRTLWSSYNKGTSSQQSWTAPAGAWLLLSEVSAFVPKAVGWEFLRNHWQILEKQESFPSGGVVANSSHAHSAAWAADRVHLLQTISNVALELPPDAAADLAAELLERLEGFAMDPAEVGAHVKALHTLCIRKATSTEEGDQLVNTWVEDLLEQAGRILESYVESSGRNAADPYETPKSGRSRTKISCSEKKGRRSKSGNLSQQIITAVFTVGCLVLICPKAKAGKLVNLLQTIITSNGGKVKKSSHEEKNGVTEDLASGVFAQAWVALGKMCLANLDLAKDCIPLFLQELERSDSAPVRNNIMVAMADFCVRYTSLIDGYIHTLTKSLRDPCELVRRQGFVLLAQLLQRDYLKWRGTLFHRFLLALVDDSEKICHLANFLFGSILKTKAPLLAYNSFVETVYTLNDCHAHAGHTDMLQTSQSERELFCLRGRGEAVVEKRMHIYTCLLKQMAPEHILATSAKLCADILAAAADGLLNLDDPTAQCVLEDSLKILASKEMRIGGKQGVNVAENLEMEEEGAAAFAAVKGRVVTQLAKRNLVQNAIPIFIELKRLLESKNSPLTGMLMECMRVMLKEYKNEIEEILVADKQLQKEIMYDMQKHEASKAKAKVVAAATAARSPGSALHQRNSSANNRMETCDGAANSALQKATPSQPAGGKENVDARGKNIDLGEEAPNRSLRSKGKRKTFLSPEASSRVKWDLNGASTSRTPGSYGMATPKALGREPSTEQLMGTLQEPNVASAVADVVAEATAAAVLSEVARGSSTPLQAMSLPRLHATVPTTVKKASFLSKEHKEGTDGGDVATLGSLDSVRRRQSFSSIDMPGGGGS